ncbi:uncharacterized protein LOC117323958 isoform X2 [Pecten maximus]|nr:uncharacterized protein LOC117323958 isoform X2 [Pecten maximus]
MSKDAVENEDTSYSALPSLNMENLPSDVMNFDDQLMNQILGVEQNGMSLDSGDNSLSSHMSQASHGSLGSSVPQPSPFASILQPIHQPVINPSMEVALVNSIIRFRYDSELNNRRTGKEELLKIKFTGVEGNVKVLLHTVDTNNKKAHPYWLIGEKCSDGMFVATMPINSANNYECTCKATLKIPKRNEYQTSLQARHRKAMELNILNNNIKNEDYWTANKNMKECRDFRLYVEAQYEVAGNVYHMHCITHPLSNAKEGKCFMIHRIMPYVSPVSGINNCKDYIMIVLTADSYIPKAVEVEFVDEEVGWSAKAAKVNIIKNCIECEVPPYQDQDLKGAREVIIKIHDKQKSMIAAYNFMYKGNEETQMAKKRKMAVNYCAPPDLLQESGIKPSSCPDQRRPVIKASRIRKQGSGGFIVVPRTSQSSTTTTTEQTISHFGINALDQLPQLIVKKEPTDTYEGACGYQGNNSAMLSAGMAVTNLLTRGQDPNLQSMSDNRTEPAIFNQVSLLLPSGSDGSDREISMETSRPASTAATATITNVGGNSNYSQSDQMKIQRIMQELVAGSPGQPTGQNEVSEPQSVDDVTALLQSAMQNAGGQENLQLTIPEDVSQMLNQPMYSIPSNLGGRDSTPTQSLTGFPARQTFNPSLQRNAQDIQNMLSAQYQYPDYEGIGATEAGDLETDGDSQAPNTIRLVWEPNKDSHEEPEELSDTESDGDNQFHNKFSSHTEDSEEPKVVRAEAVLVKRTHPSPSAQVSGKESKIKDSCDTCSKNKSSENEKEIKGKTQSLQNETSDLETNTCSNDRNMVGKCTDQTDRGVCTRVGEVESEDSLHPESQRLSDAVEEGKSTIPDTNKTDKPKVQEDVSESLKKLTL